MGYINKQSEKAEQKDRKNKNKLKHKNIDARWTKKNAQHYYEYTNPVKAYFRRKLIDNHTVTDASVHDSQASVTLVVIEF